jgi:hypothetical protein
MNIKFLCESLQHFDQKAIYISDTTCIVNGYKLTVKDSVLYFDAGKVRSIGADGFLKNLMFEGVLVNVDKTAVLLEYNYLVNKHSFAS